MATVNNLYSELTHPFVQESEKSVSWSHASRKSTHNSASYRRDTTTAEVVAPVSDYITNYAECWFSSSNDLPYKDYWSLKGQEKADAFNECGTCAYKRIGSLNYSEQRFEYNRLGNLGWPTYTGESFYVI